MKVQQQQPTTKLMPCKLDLSTTSSIGPKRLRPIAPSPITGRDLKALIDHACQRVGYDTLFKPTAHQCGGTRWNPTDEQIRILESLYGRGLRTPSAKHIEEIAAELRRYGSIEGKNVFYWFQNHKARERQKRKRSAAAAVATLPPQSTSTSFSPPGSHHSMCEEVGSSESEEEVRLNKRRTWGVASERETACGGDLALLELFPLHPERESTSSRSRLLSSRHDSSRSVTVVQKICEPI